MNNSVWAIALSMLLLMSCSDNHSHDKELAQPELQPLTYTLYSQKAELFVEFMPLVVGTESRFATHLTLLGETFLPLSEGPVTVKLVVNGQTTEVTATKAEVPGIFRLQIIPETAGVGKLIFIIGARSIKDEIIIENVTIYPDEKTALAKQVPDIENAEIPYLKEQAWKTDFATTIAEKKHISSVIKTTGQIISAPGDEIILVANASGIVRLSGSGTITGTSVNAGTKLFSIIGSNLTQNNIDAGYREAKTNFENAELNFKRSELLAIDKIISAKELQQAKADYENAKTAYNTVSKNYQSGNGLAILAPEAGFLGDIKVSDGAYVEAGTMLTTISKNKKLRLVASVSHNYYSNLSGLTGAKFKISGTGQIFNTTLLKGRVLAIGKSTNASSPFIPVTFEIDNPGNIIPGVLAEVFLLVDPGENTLAVPVSSLIEEQGTFYVFVQSSGEGFQKREIKTGAGDGEYIQVLSGITEGERVVTKGAYQIKLAAASGAIPAHGHEH